MNEPISICCATRLNVINKSAIAFSFQVNKLEKETKAKADAHSNEEPDNNKKQVGQLILLYVDDELSDSMELGEARKKAFKILPKESIRTIGEKMIKKHKPKRKQFPSVSPYTIKLSIS